MTILPKAVFVLWIMACVWSVAWVTWSFVTRRYSPIVRLWRRRRAFSFATFGPPEVRGPVGPLRHLRKEAEEVVGEALLEHGEHLREEMADCFILILDAADRMGLSLGDLIAEAQAKMAINEAREWPDWRTCSTTEPIEHVREMPEIAQAVEHVVLSREGANA